MTTTARPFVIVPIDLMGQVEKYDHLIVAMAIKHFMRDGRSCWPSVKQLAELIHRSAATVRRLLKEMVSLGYLTIERRQPKGGGQMTNLYRLAERFFHNAARRVKARRAAAPPLQRCESGQSTRDSQIDSREENQPIDRSSPLPSTTEILDRFRGPTPRVPRGPVAVSAAEKYQRWMSGLMQKARDVLPSEAIAEAWNRLMGCGDDVEAMRHVTRPIERLLNERGIAT